MTVTKPFDLDRFYRRNMVGPNRCLSIVVVDTSVPFFRPGPPMWSHVRKMKLRPSEGSSVLLLKVEVPLVLEPWTGTRRRRHRNVSEEDGSLRYLATRCLNCRSTLH